MMKKYLSLLCFCVIMSACKTTPVMDDNWPVERYFRLAQDYSDRGKYKEALYIYDQVYVRFPSMITKVAAAEYEQGFIYFKTKDYKKASELFQTVIGRFSSNYTAASFSQHDQWILVSATNMLAKVQQKEKIEQEKEQQKQEKKRQKELKKQEKAAKKAEASQNNSFNDNELQNSTTPADNSIEDKAPAVEEEDLSEVPVP